MNMNWKKLILSTCLCLFISFVPACAETIKLNEEQSKLNYTLSCLGIPIKKKALPASGQIDVERFDSQTSEKIQLKGLKLTVKFTSKNPLFRKTIDYDKYPDFKFFSDLDKPLLLQNRKLTELTGDLSFHGVTKKITIKLKNKSEGDLVSLIGFLNIKMTDFEIIPPRILFIFVDNVIKTKVELYAVVK